MALTTAVVVVVALVLFGGILLFALHRKGDVKAGGSFGNGSFYLEVRDRKRRAK